jgi:hypothetical protein
MTPVDALDTMILMGLKTKRRTTREYIATHLSFDKDISVQNFEITIRLLGGLLSAYEMTGDKRLLNLAEDLGNRSAARFQFADRFAVSLRQSQNRRCPRKRDKSGRSRNAPHRVWGPRATHASADFL